MANFFLLLRTTYCTIESSLQKNGRTNTDNLPSNLLLLSALPFPALAALTGHQNRPQSSQQTHEMTVPNELIGCIIGKGGSKIAEIRYEYCMKSDICILHVVVSRPWLSLKTEVILVHELRWGRKGFHVLLTLKIRDYSNSMY